MSQSKEVRYTSRSVTPPSERRSRSRSSSRPRGRSRSRSPGGERSNNPGNNLYVTGLSTRVTDSDLERYFSKEGKVVECHVVEDPRTKQSRGFGFVTMDTLEDANSCVKYLDKSVLDGRLIRVEKAKRNRGRTPTPGMYHGRGREMSQSKEVRYTSRSVTPPSERRSRSRSTSRPRGRSRSRSPGGERSNNHGTNLYVTGLSTRVTDSDLERYFSKEGKVVECRVVEDPRTKQSRGFGFVTMDNLEDANRCVKYLDKSVLEGRLIRVEKAKRSRGRTPTPGVYRGRGRDHDRRSRSRSPHRARSRDRSPSRD